MSRFLHALHSGRVLLMDGAMGTELQRAGLPPGESGESWNLSRPQAVRAIHQAYVEAGADVLLTNTFQAIPPPSVLAQQRDDKQIHGVIEQALALAKNCAGPDRFVIADLGPVMESASFEELAANKPLIRLVQSLAHADALLMETCSTPRALEAVQFFQDVVARDMNPFPPIMLSLTYQHDPMGDLVTFSGHSPEFFAGARVNVAALGVNCGKDIDTEDILQIVRRYRQATDLPLFARANAGTPTRQGERWIYPRSPDDLAAGLPDLLEAGTAMVGGCCGTTPDHIAAMRPIVDAWNARLS